MAFKLPNRVKEGWTGTGTGNITLGGNFAGFFTFASQFSDGDTTHYCIENPGQNEAEFGLGTIASSGTVLQRTTVIGGTNGTSAVSFSAGTKNVFVSPLNTDLGSVQLIASATASGSSQTLDLTGLDNACKAWLVTVRGIKETTSDGDLFGFRVGTGSTSWQTSSYAWGLDGRSIANVIVAAGSVSTTALIEAGHNGIFADGGGFLQMTIANPGSGALDKHIVGQMSAIKADGSDGYQCSFGGIWFGGTAALTGLRFMMSSGSNNLANTVVADVFKVN